MNSNYKNFIVKRQESTILYPLPLHKISSESFLKSVSLSPSLKKSDFKLVGDWNFQGKKNTISHIVLTYPYRYHFNCFLSLQSFYSAKNYNINLFTCENVQHQIFFSLKYTLSSFHLHSVIVSDCSYFVLKPMDCLHKRLIVVSCILTSDFMSSRM